MRIKEKQIICDSVCTRVVCGRNWQQVVSRAICIADVLMMMYHTYTVDLQLMHLRRRWHYDPGCSENPTGLSAALYASSMLRHVLRSYCLLFYPFFGLRHSFAAILLETASYNETTSIKPEVNTSFAGQIVDCIRSPAAKVQMKLGKGKRL